MKTIIYLFSFFIFVKAYAQTNTSLINHIPIGDSGICFSLTDESHITDTNRTEWLYDREIFAGSTLFWILHNSTNHRAGVLFTGMDHSFSLKLSDNQGHNVPYTEYGSLMNSGPQFTNHLSLNHPHRLASDPDGVRVMAFPNLEQIFQPLHKGDYLLELRYWYWNVQNKYFQLTDPVRMKVIVRLDKTIIPNITNASNE